MVKWKKETILKANIEKAWKMFLDENIKQIMPKIEDHQLLENKNDEVGAKHAQTFYEGNQLETYIVETIAYLDLPDKKHKQIHFVMRQTFDVMYSFTLVKMNENQTKFIYVGHTKGVSVIGKTMLLMASRKKQQQTIQNFIDRVKVEAEKTL